jgi:hypothetical protein
MAFAVHGKEKEYVPIRGENGSGCRRLLRYGTTGVVESARLLNLKEL